MTDFYDTLLAGAIDGGGGGSSVTVESLTATENTTYTAPEGKAYSPVVVNVPVGWTTDGIAQNIQPSGDITISSSVNTIGERAFYQKTQITSLTIEGNPYIGSFAFNKCTGITAIHAPNLSKFKASYYSASSDTFDGCTGLTTIALPSLNDQIGNYVFQGCTNLATADLGNCNKIVETGFKGDSALRTLILRSTSVVNLTGYSANYLGGIYSNPTQSAVYVPQNLITSYQSATNWSSLYNANNNVFKAIEGTTYETNYADGTPIGG